MWCVPGVCGVWIVAVGWLLIDMESPRILCLRH